jgi:hypothetical protein
VLADRVEDHVVPVDISREVLAQTIDNIARAKRSHDLDVFRVAYRGHLVLDVVGE